MIEKVRLGYEPSYTIDEFVMFLQYFRQYKEVYDVLDDGEELFNRFFLRKVNNWDVRNYNGEKRIPHIVRDNNGILMATNSLSFYDDIGFLGDKEQKEVENIIGMFLKDFPRRGIDISTHISYDMMNLGQVAAAFFIYCIWNGYCSINSDNGWWPKQCVDIDKYLLDTDLAKYIGIPSIREDILTFYDCVSKRIAVLFQNDPQLLISNKNINYSYLAYSNYRSVVDGYDELMGFVSRYGFRIDFNKKIFSYVNYSGCLSSEVSVNLMGKMGKKLAKSLNLANNRDK